jgi:hypothetical protein
MRQPCPLWGRGHMRFICSTGIPDPWLYNAIATGGHSGGPKPLERLRFWSLNRNTILITFFLVIFYELVVKMALHPILNKKEIEHHEGYQE